jgi:uncharacterized protein YbjT (DUF2867 family)
MPNKKHVLFAGSTGGIGKRLLSHLIARNAIDEIHLLLRRPMGIENPRVFEHIVDFKDLSKLKINTESSGETISFCTLGTTIKKAGSKQNFSQVDLDFVFNFAKWASNNGSEQFAVISSLDANPNSKNFYLKTKGQMESSIKQLPWKSAWILRPSLLLGKRDEFRLAEFVGGALSKIVSPLLIGRLRRYRPIHMDHVATTLTSLIESSGTGNIVLESDQIFEIATGHK